MSNESELLDATLRHLKSLQERGTRFVNVDAALLERLTQPVVQKSHPAVAPPPRGLAATSPGLGVRLASASVQNAHAPAAASRLTPAPASPVGAPELFASSGEKAEATAAAGKPLLDPSAKIAAMADLRSRALACVKCPNLAAARRNVVFGVGDINAELMFVGEAPGADEDVQGEPFVGAAGQLLTKIIQTMGLSRQQVYIGNILKCRPDTPGQSSGNRKPTPEEMTTCIPYLHEQIDLIGPKVLVALGATAVEGLLGKTIGITKLRGNWRTYRGIPLMPTYHPAYLLRNQALAEKRRVWEDMLQVMEKLGLPISDKQQRFFLPK